MNINPSTEVERRAAGKAAHKLHLSGKTDDDIAAELRVDEWLVTELRKRYQESVPSPEQHAARQTAIARTEADLLYLAEIQGEIKAQYDQELIDVKDYARFGVMVVKTKTDIGVRYAKLLDLDSATKIDLTSNTKLDDEIIELSRKFGAREEADLPLE